MRIPRKLTNDPRYAQASVGVRFVYWQIYKLPRIQAAEGGDLVDMLMVIARHPRRREVEDVLRELLERGLLIAQPDGSVIPAHAPKPKEGSG